MSDDYLLGHDPVEWARLESQNALWRGSLLEALASAGVGPGSRLLEVGCGPGFLLEDLAGLVGPGCAAGLERDPEAALAAAVRSGAPVLAGDLMTADLLAVDPFGGALTRGPAGGGRWDAIVARWVFSFLPDPAAALRRLAAALAPGGVLLIQDYIHDPTKLYPEHPAIVATVEAFRAAYRARGGDLWVAGRIPGLMVEADLGVEAVAPRSFAGGPGSPAFEWVGRFLHLHLGGVVEGGFLSADQAAAFREAWAERAADPGAVMFTPLVVAVTGRRAG